VRGGLQFFFDPLKRRAGFLGGPGARGAEKHDGVSHLVPLKALHRLQKLAQNPHHPCVHTGQEIKVLVRFDGIFFHDSLASSSVLHNIGLRF